MDRSSTPRASQQQQRQQGSSSSSTDTRYGNIGIGPRRGKNRSRSGSEELSQIIAEAQAAQRARNEQKTHSNGFWPLSNGFSRPTSVTPTPHNLNGNGQLDEHTEGEQSRTTSPGLLSWVRNAIMLGPSGRTIPFDENNDTNSQKHRFSHTDPIKRNQTPLLPGTIPSFHHIDRQKMLEPPLIIREGPRSERSSISFDGASSAGHDSLESYDYSASIRRSSTVSSVSTESSTVDSFHRTAGTDATINDTEDDDSDQEDIYAPFAQRQHGPSLIRPTARREALGFGPPSPPTTAPQNEFQYRTPSTALGHKYGITGSEHNLNISEGE
ncbi:uncharacterized protein FA14DRAFT_156720 [Meira miltonrushii]|uniref:Uncharacterized protein n=1 Tax=Meira miltonrushii TaxID=1280837 RepID=A0A316V981_9BASI|nr:uncharacterized protein FA14DRAFT_156720 [Meira miltonrushii]PWN34050.1 hypothetical protein FA14DRAFT_156720 [Meira miltonrushii]